MLVAGVNFPEVGLILARVVDALPVARIVTPRPGAAGLLIMDPVDPPSDGGVIGPLFVTFKAFQAPKQAPGPAPKGHVAEWARIPLPIGADSAPQGAVYVDPQPGMVLWLHPMGVVHWCEPLVGGRHCVGRILSIESAAKGRDATVGALIWPPRYLSGLGVPVVKPPLEG